MRTVKIPVSYTHLDVYKRQVLVDELLPAVQDAGCEVVICTPYTDLVKMCIRDSLCAALECGLLATTALLF